MRFRETSVVSVLLALVLCFVLVGALAGCGGGGSEESGSGGQEKKQEEKAAGKAAGKAAKKEPLPRKVAIGTVRAFKDDKRRLSLRPAANAQSKKPLGFKVRKNAKVTLRGKAADLADVQEGQQAQITYVVKNDVNRAIVVHLFDAQPSGEKEKKEQPSGEKEKPSGEGENN